MENERLKKERIDEKEVKMTEICLDSKKLKRYYYNIILFDFLLIIYYYIYKIFKNVKSQ